MKVIVKMKFGSHLYGTDTPESDTDYKGIFLPEYKDLLMGTWKKTINKSTGNDFSKNTTTDVDIEFYSLHYFLGLAKKGETAALDMLHAPDNMIIQTSWIWKELQENRTLFYTKNLKAFIGYARRQAAKYGIKGSRLNTVRTLIDNLYHFEETTKLKDVWEQLPEGDHIHKLPPDPKDQNNCRIYQVVGKKFLETVRIQSVLESLQAFETSYGARAQLAAENKGIDWKAISHALRAAYQVQSLFLHNTINFPLKEADFLKEVKQGKLDYLTVVSPILESLIEHVETLSIHSTLPEKVDEEYWNNWLYKILNIYYLTPASRH